MQKKPLLLLKLLIALGGRNISVSQLEEALWSDAEGDVARSCLKTNVQRLRRLYQMLVQNTGKAFESQQAWQQTAEIYRRGLNINELAEGFYQGLMRYHCQAGEKAEAILVYRQCHQALAAGLGITPSRITSALYRAIVADNGLDNEC